jgi:hypothetical protein
MATPAPTTAELMAIITTLQAQIVELQNAAPAVAAAPPASTATVIFTDTPQMLGANDLIDYLTKRGSTIFEQGCKALNDKTLSNGFAMTPDQTVIFVKAFHCPATTMGGTKAPCKLPRLPTAPVAKLTSSKVMMAKLTRPLLSLHVIDSLSLGKSITRPVESRITQ